MASTYEPIATTTLATAAANYTFTSIPATYTDLRIVLATRSSSTTLDGYYSLLQFNSDTATNYSMTAMYGDGTAPASIRYTNIPSYRTPLSINGTSTSVFSLTVFDIFSYANTSVYKTILSSVGNQNSNQPAALKSVGLWRSTAAISSILIGLQTGNLIAGTVITLYGVKAA